MFDNKQLLIYFITVLLFSCFENQFKHSFWHEYWNALYFYKKINEIKWKKNRKRQRKEKKRKIQFFSSKSLWKLYTYVEIKIIPWTWQKAANLSLKTVPAAKKIVTQILLHQLIYKLGSIWFFNILNLKSKLIL